MNYDRPVLVVITPVVAFFASVLAFGPGGALMAAVIAAVAALVIGMPVLSLARRFGGGVGPGHVSAGMLDLAISRCGDLVV